MKLPNLEKVNPNFLEDSITIETFFNQGKVESDRKNLEAFKKKWVSCKATLTDWIKVGPIDIDAIITSENLTATDKRNIKTRQKNLYDLWIETCFQYLWIPEIEYVISVTPLYASKYAQRQLNLIELLLKGKDISKLEHGSWVLNIEKGVKYKSLLQIYSASNYESKHDIYSKSKVNWLELVLHYKRFLERFIHDPTIERPYNPDNLNDLEVFKLYPNTVIAYSRLYVLYYCSDKSSNKDKDLHYQILEVNKCRDQFIFQKELLRIVNEEYQNTLVALKSVGRPKRQEFLENLIYEVERWRGRVLSEDEYMREGNSFREARYYTFKRLNYTAFAGNNDAELIFDPRPSSAYKCLLRKVEPYANVINDCINHLIKRLRDGLHNVDKGDRKEKTVVKKIAPPISFVYKDIRKNPSKLRELYNSLKDSKFIENTPFTVFRRVFTGMNVETKIIWRRGVGALCYFIKQVHGKKKKIEEMTETELWTTACHCFEMPNGEQFEYNRLRKATLPENEKVRVLLDEMIDQI